MIYNSLAILNRLKRRKLIVDYAVTGSIGTMFYTEPFLTRTIHVLTIPPDKKLQVSTLFAQILRKTKMTICFTPWDDEFAKEAAKNALVIKYKNITTKVLTPEYLIAMFLKGPKDWSERGVLIDKLLTQAKVDKRRLDEILRWYRLTGRFKRFVNSGAKQPYPPEFYRLRVDDGKTIKSLAERFDDKLRWRKAQAKLPFARKMEILGELREIADKMNSIRAVPALMWQLKNRHKEVRAMAIDTLCEMGCRQSIPAIIKQLGDTSGQVRQSALRAIRKLNARTAIPQIKRLLDDPDEHIANEAWATIAKFTGKNYIWGAYRLFDKPSRSAGLKRRNNKQDIKISAIFDAIKQLMAEDEKPRPRIGFHQH